MEETQAQACLLLTVLGGLRAFQADPRPHPIGQVGAPKSLEGKGLQESVMRWEG